MTDTPRTDAAMCVLHPGVQPSTWYVQAEKCRGIERDLNLHRDNQALLIRALTDLLAATDPPSSITRYRKWAEAKRKAEELVASMDSAEELERETA